MQKVIVTIDADGHVQIEVDGVVGKTCHDVTADLEKLLGHVDTRQHKPDYHRTPSVGQQQHAGQ